MRCGKSRLVDLIDKLMWKSSGSVINTSLAALYYMTAEGCTFLADEVENLKNSDREQFGAIIGIINAGFAKGATLRRMVQVEGEWVQKKFPVYGPKVLSGISTVTDTIRDRSLAIIMVRKSRKERVARFNMRREAKALSDLSNSMALWAEENGKSIQDIYDGLPDEPELDGCDDRFFDIIEGLLAIVKFADAESANGAKRDRSNHAAIQRPGWPTSRSPIRGHCCPHRFIGSHVGYQKGALHTVRGTSGKGQGNPRASMDRIDQGARDLYVKTRSREPSRSEWGISAVTR